MEQILIHIVGIGPSEPKRLVRPSLATDGTDCGGCPGRTAVVASVLMLALDGLWGRQVS